MRLVLVLLLAVVAPAQAAWGGCAPIAMQAPGVWRASVSDDSVDITFLGHASFEIESPHGVRAITDYNGMNIRGDPPDIATMNHAHSTHYTLTPDPHVAHILHGWAENGRVPTIDLTVEDMHVSNLPTNIRTWDGGTERHGNSIFVFETGGLCIAHLGHLHHRLEPADIDALGHIDIVMVAVDGEWTMSQSDAVAVLDQLQPRIVLPMHYFTRQVLARFLELTRGRYVIDARASPVMTISRSTLPSVQTVIALPGGY